MEGQDKDRVSLTSSLAPWNIVPFAQFAGR